MECYLSDREAQLVMLSELRGCCCNCNAAQTVLILQSTGNIFWRLLLGLPNIVGLRLALSLDVVGLLEVHSAVMQVGLAKVEAIQISSTKFRVSRLHHRIILDLAKLQQRSPISTDMDTQSEVY